MEIFRSTPYENTKLKCFSILLTASKWQRLIYILNVMETGENRIAESSQVALGRWIEDFNRSYVIASKVQTELISEIIKRLDGKLPEMVKRNLVFLTASNFV